MTAVSIFTGADGLDIGIERAGGDLLSTLEIHPSYCATVRNMKAKGVVNPRTGRAYFQDAKIIQGDIRDMSAGEALKGLLALFQDAGYNCRVKLLNSADYGSPQRRVRCFVLGSSIAAAPEFPRPTHAAAPVDSLFEPERLKRWVTLGDYLAQNADTIAHIGFCRRRSWRRRFRLFLTARG